TCALPIWVVAFSRYSQLIGISGRRAQRWPKTIVPREQGSMRLNIVVLPGDGVGPEVTEQAVSVLREVAGIHGHSFHFQEYPVGGEAIRSSGSPLPAATLDACLKADAVLLG